MGVNSIAQVKTVEVQGADGPTVAMMIALDVGDAATVEAFVTDVAERFKLDRMLAPPQTSMLLFTIIGSMSAEAFSARWKEIVKADPVIHAFMGLMNVAEVVQGTKAGQKLGSASLLEP
jgi:hypothetical protein